LEYKAIKLGRIELDRHPTLIHFPLEQIERVLSTGCMEWTNAEGRQPAHFEPGSGMRRV